MVMKRRRSFGRRPKKIVRWFVSDQTYMDRHTVRSQSSLATVSFAILAMHPRQTSVTPDLVTATERHTVEAVRGQILLTGSSDSNLNAHMGIRVVDLDSSGVPVVFDPTVSAEGSDEWMWLHHTTVWLGSLGAIGSPAQDVPVHIKSRRVLRDNQALVLFYSVTTTFLDGAEQANGTVAFYPYLRTLVSHPE